MFLVSLGVTFFLTPFVVRTLGNAAYGFWVVLLSFVGYAGVLELGVQPAVVKLVGQHRGSQDKQKLEELVTAAFLFLGGVGLLAALFVAFVIPPFVPLIAKELQGFSGLNALFLLVAADVFVLFLNYLFTGVLYGWQQYHIKNLIDISVFVLNAVIIVAFLAGGGLVLLAISKVCTDLLGLIATIALCRRMLPEFRPTLARVSRRSFRELLGFGGKLFVSATTSRVSNYAQPLIISSQISTSATAFFAIPMRIVEYSKQITWALSAGFMPMFSEYDGRKDDAAVRFMYLRYSRYILLIVLPILVLIFIFGRDFIGLWIGPEYAVQGRTVLYLLTAATLIETLQPLLWRLFIGVGRLDVLVGVSASTSLLAVILSFLLIRPMGIAGVAFSVLLTVAIAQAVFFWYAARYFEIRPWHLFLETQGRALLAGAVFSVIALIMARILGMHSYVTMAIATFISILAYLPIAFISLHSSERQKLLSLIRGRLFAAVR
jgi:O-antigen/teichoic acid export membrane protein